MMKLKIVSTFAMLAMFVALTACGSENTAGTDEQANSLTALDSALAQWTTSNTLIAPEQQDPPCTDCSMDIIHSDQYYIIREPGVEVKNGTLYNVARDNFESLTCENDSNWFVYSVNAGDSLIRKYLVLPDSLDADEFESDCIAEGGVFDADTTTEITGQKTHSCDLENAGHLSEGRQYVDPNWKKYVELIVGICRD